jgi:hypothetical protein
LTEVDTVRLASAAVAVAMLLFTSVAFAQTEQPFDVVKAERSESFSVSYAAANDDRRAPFVYAYDEPKGQNWIMSIENTLSYVAREDAKAVVILRDEAPSEKYIEIQMFGGEHKKYSVWTNIPETGYSNIYLNEERGWWTDQPIGLSFSGISGITVTDGKRTVVDRLNIGEFNLSSVEVYGKDEQGTLSNAHAGKLSIGVIYGSPAETPVYMVPAIVTAGMGGVVGLLLLVKKRKR